MLRRFAAAWRGFHKERAKYRVLCVPCSAGVEAARLQPEADAAPPAQQG